MMRLCQGNGCGPQFWSIISSMVFSVLCTQGFGIHFIKYFTTEIAQLVGCSYVDNCDMIQSYDDIESTHSQMQLEISWWEYLIIIITGGFLAPYKSVWYLVDYEWIWGKWKWTNMGQYKSWKLPINKEKNFHYVILRKMNQCSCWECILHGMAIKNIKLNTCTKMHLHGQLLQE